MFQFIESPIFEKVIYDYLDDGAYGALQAALSEWPEAGDLIPGSGGCRKLRCVCLAGASGAAFASSIT